VVLPKIHSLHSLDISAPELPPDPQNCWITLDAEIGPSHSPGADRFSFDVVTPLALAAANEIRWGSGLLILPEFSWEEVTRALARLLAQCSRPTWDEVVTALSAELRWEFENYRAGV